MRCNQKSDKRVWTKQLNYYNYTGAKQSTKVTTMRSEGLTLQQSEGFDMFLLGTQCWLLGSNEYCFQSTQVCPVTGFGQHPEMILNVLAHCTQARTWVFEMACYGAIRFWWCKNIGILRGRPLAFLVVADDDVHCARPGKMCCFTLSSSPWDVLPT